MGYPPVGGISPATTGSPYEALLQQKLELLDRHLVVTEPAEDEDCYIELDYDKDDKPVITAKQRGIK